MREEEVDIQLIVFLFAPFFSVLVHNLPGSYCAPRNTL